MCNNIILPATKILPRVFVNSFLLTDYKIIILFIV